MVSPRIQFDLLQQPTATYDYPEQRVAFGVRFFEIFFSVIALKLWV